MSTEQDRPIALIVEDNKESLKARRQLFAAHGFQPIGALSRRDAIRQLRSTPTVDIVVTDVNLERENPSDMSGVAVANEIHSQRPRLPVMGLSGRIDELPQSDLKAFTEWFPKAKYDVGAMEGRLATWRKVALDYRRKRAKEAREKLGAMRQSGGLPAAEVEAMGGFLPGTHALQPADRFATPDEILRDEGWRLHLVRAGFSFDNGKREQVRTASVVPFWLRVEGPRTIALLHGHPSIYCDDGVESAAIEGALSLMYGYYCGFEDGSDVATSGEMTALRNYLRSIFAEHV